MSWSVVTEGVDEVIDDFNDVSKNMPRSLSNAVRMATKLWERGARQKAPVDTGVLRASITSSVRSSQDAVTGVTGSNVKYALWVEEGTPPHWPPIKALEGWARRHGTTAYVVARAISKRGTKAVWYMRNTYNENKSRVEKLVDDAIKRLIDDEI